jgi:hypothetical protein
MLKLLILQILGNSDVKYQGDEGIKSLKGNSLDEVRYYAEEIEKEVQQDLQIIDFPLIKQIKDFYKNDNELYFCPVLTDQINWISRQNKYGNDWNKIIASDGIWWHNSLEMWCQHQDLRYSPLVLEVPSDIPNGVADWEKMAHLINTNLSEKIKLEQGKINFDGVEIDKVIIQHSSGTPALSSALYLWGIEQKLANYPLEFIYLSRQDSTPNQHDGKHWQWRLKVPQIEQLLSIQDFSGVRALVESPDISDKLKKKINKLDRAVSFNIEAMGLSGLTSEEKVKERIGIALWSEKAFR